MNFVVERIGKVCKADIRVDGITVIAGPNGSGKSTVGRVLMTWFSLLRRLPMRLTEERLKSAREAADAVLKTHDLPSVGYVASSDGDDKLMILRPETWTDKQSIAERLRESPEYFFGERDAQADAEKIEKIGTDIVRAIEEVIGRDGAYYVPSIIADSFETALDKSYSSQEAPAEGVVHAALNDELLSFVRFGGGRVIDWKVMPSDKVPLVFYFEPVHLLDYYAATAMKPRGPIGLRLSATGRYRAPDADWRSFLFGEADKSEWSVERKQKQAEIDAALDELMDVMRGRLEKQDRELRFVDKDVSAPVQVMNVASGIKTMSAIERGIRAGVIQPGCLMIVDEPESNLHPQWQVEFAHFLVKLNARFGMRFLLNTHSPFFLKAVEVFSREEGCGGSTHYYHMEKDAVEFGYRTKELKDGTNGIFKTYFDAMNDLMSR